MEEIKDFEQQTLASFAKSFTKRYEQWKREDLLVLAIETMPKQVNKSKLLRNLIALTRQQAENLNE